MVYFVGFCSALLTRVVVSEEYVLSDSLPAWYVWAFVVFDPCCWFVCVAVVAVCCCDVWASEFVADA